MHPLLCGLVCVCVFFASLHVASLGGMPVLHGEWIHSGVRMCVRVVLQTCLHTNLCPSARQVNNATARVMTNKKVANPYTNGKTLVSFQLLCMFLHSSCRLIRFHSLTRTTPPLMGLFMSRCNSHRWLTLNGLKKQTAGSACPQTEFMFMFD